MRRRTFSLIELVIVVVILGILAAIAVPRMSQASSGAAAVAAAQTAALIRDVVDRETATEGEIPSDVLPSWFAGNHVPPNPYAPHLTPVVRVSATGDATKLHPKGKTVDVTPLGAYWYNSANGVFRARVAKQASNSETIDLYNRVNDADITLLNQTN